MTTADGPRKLSGEVKVASRIIDYLSSGLYKSPAACLKELINNAYDADARSVSLYVMPDADTIMITDDGAGLTADKFEEHFQRISESHKRDDSEHTPSGRPKIGKIGIGFIAANELCDEMQILSTTKGNADLLDITLDFAEMRKPIEERRRDENQFVKADYHGEVIHDEEPEYTHYTQIFLKRVRGHAQDILVGAAEAEHKGQGPKLYGLNDESVENFLREGKFSSWQDLDAYSKTMLQVALNVPVRYHENWLPEDAKSQVSDIENKVFQSGFSVNYDGTPLRKPTVFRPRGKYFVEPFHFEGDEVSASGYFYAQHGNIKPYDLQGLLLRIRQAAVGEYDSSFWEFSQSEFPLIQRWVSAEIWADDRLEDAMNIDRRTLRDTHPAYVELRQAVHEKLRHVLRKARSDIYGAESEHKRQTKAVSIKHKSDSIVNRYRSPVANNAHTKKTETEGRSDDSFFQDANNTKVLRKYSVDEILEIVEECSSDFPRDLQSELVVRIAEKLKG